MDIATVSFYISLVGILGMIGLRSFEIRSGKRPWLSRLADNTDHLVHDFFGKVTRGISYINKKSAVALIQWIAYHILSWARKVYIWAHRKAHAHPPSKKVIDMVRGKGEVKKNGGASVYLKRISEVEDNQVQ
jgi:hypothetical protein